MNSPRNFDRLARLVRGAVAGLGVAAALAVPVPAVADDLGRLFFTPQERQDLDRRRASNVVERDAPAAAESLVTVNGQVTRSSGRTTTWINGVAHDDTYRSHDPSQVPVRGRSVKIGETLDRSRGTVKDPLQGGEIQIHRAPAR